MLQRSKLRDLYVKDSKMIGNVQGELKRSLHHKKLPTELHMIQCAKRREGLSYEVTGHNIATKIKSMKQALVNKSCDSRQEHN